MDIKIDLSNLTDEQKAYVSSLETLVGSLQESLKEKDKEIEELKQLLVKEKSIVKQYNVERFVSKQDIPKSNGVKSTIPKNKKTPGRKKGSKNFGDGYLEELSKLNDPISLDIAKSMKNTKLVKIDEETTYLIKRVKASTKVFKVIIPVYKDENNKIYRAENNLTPIHHGIISSSLLSDAITMKYFLGIPEYRYAKWLESEGLPFNQRTLNNWRLQTFKAIEPFYNKLKTLFSDKSLDIKSIHIDETYLDVIDNKQEGRDKSYVFCYSAKTKYGYLPLFEYSRTRETTTVNKNLQGYDEAIVVDGYAGYNSIKDGKITKQRCMVHARREFANIVKTLNKEQKKKSKAYEVIRRFDAIFHKEAIFKEMKLTPEQILEERQSVKYKALVDELNNYIASLNPESKSPLYKAVNYWNNLKGEQWTYLNNGHIQLDNNEAERQAKKFVIDRKNFLFAKSEEGAKSSCALLTLIDLAYANKYDPRDYLEYVLDNIKFKPFEELLPWSKEFKNYMKNT